MLNPSHLRTLLVVLEQGSFAAAANRLGYTPSAVSQQVASLEASVGVTLFDRGARFARPTHAARVMAQRAQAVLSELDALEQAVRNESDSQDSAHPVLRVSLYPSLVAPLSPYFSDMMLPHGSPRRVRLSVRDPSLSVKALVDGEDIDVSVVYRVEHTELNWPKTLECVELGTDPYQLVVPRSWGALSRAGGEDHTDIDALRHRPWVMHHLGSSDSEVIERLFTEHRMQPKIVARADDFAVALQLVALGFAGAFIPRIALGGAADLPADVVVLDAPEIQLTRTVWALVAPTAPAEETNALVAELRKLHDFTDRTPPSASTPA